MIRSNSAVPLGLAALACSLLILLSGCGEDLTPVDSDLQDDLFEGGEPTSRLLSPTTFDTETDPPATGGFVRILAGVTDDPLLATYEATGSMKLGFPDGASDGFTDEDAPITEAELELDWDYIYGDTLSTPEYELFVVTEDWESEDRSSDADNPATDEANPVAQFTASPTDSSTTIDITEWAETFNEENNNILQDSTTFSDDFEGLQLQPVDGDAVLGFDAITSSLRITVDDDFTETFSLSESFSGIRTDGTPTPPDDQVVLQDGIGYTTAFIFDLDDDLRNGPVNRARITLPVDPSPLEEPVPESYVRPLASTFEIDLFVAGDDEPVATFQNLTVDEDADAIRLVGGEEVQLFDPDLGPQVASPRDVFEAIAIDDDFELDRFRLRADPEETSLNPMLLLPISDPPEAGPHLDITVSGTD